MNIMRRHFRLAIVLGIIGLAAVGCAVEQSGPGAAMDGHSHAGDMMPEVTKAVCVVHPLGDSGVMGTVTFTLGEDGVTVLAELTGLTPGEHGFHVHQYGDCTAADGTSAGGHFNPHGMDHSGPDSEDRHAGDLGNIPADADGNASYSRTDSMLELNGPESIIGRSIIVHAGQDDLMSQPSGAAGPRIGCGVIGIAMSE